VERPSELESSLQAGRPSRRHRTAVSALILVHFIAIGTAVTSSSSPTFPAPQLAVAASQPFQPYLQATALNNAYRFFAPNPGTPSLFWFRVQDGSGAVRWSELPGRADTPLARGSYQRRLNLSLLLGQQIIPDAANPDRLSFSPTGETCLASVVRHVADTEAPSQAPITSVGVYVVQHAVVTPEQARNGWTPDDLRTFRALFVGAFDANGERRGERTQLVEQSLSQVAAGVLWVDVHPRMRSGGDSSAVIQELRLPRPLRTFFERHRESLDSSMPRERLQVAVEAWMNGR
jgi:hypothetical protein